MENKEYEKLFFDIPNILNFVFEAVDEPNSSEITELYSVNEVTNGLSLINKQINETKNAKNDSNTAIKYDLIKNLMLLLCDIQEGNDITLGQRFALNSFVTQGFIKKID